MKGIVTQSKSRLHTKDKSNKLMKGIVTQSKSRLHTKDKSTKKLAINERNCNSKQIKLMKGIVTQSKSRLHSKDRSTKLLSVTAGLWMADLLRTKISLMLPRLFSEISLVMNASSDINNTHS